MIIDPKSSPYLRMRLQCMLQERRNLDQIITDLFDQVGVCCPSSSSSQVPSSSSALPSSSSSLPSSSSSVVCPELDEEMLFDEWIWSEGTNNNGGTGVDTWTGARKGKVLTTVALRPDNKRAKVQDNCILINGDPLDKRAYHAQFPNDWYSGSSDTAYSNCIFAVVEIDLFKTGESTLWNHIITGQTDASFSTFSSQTSTDTIGSRTNSSVYFSSPRPAWMSAGVKRYIVEMRYGEQGVLGFNDFNLLVNGYSIVNTGSPYACRNIFGVGVVAPQDISANSTLNRRLLSVLALKNPAGLDQRLPVQKIQNARNYLACNWGVQLEF